MHTAASPSACTPSARGSPSRTKRRRRLRSFAMPRTSLIGSERVGSIHSPVAGSARAAASNGPGRRIARISSSSSAAASVIEKIPPSPGKIPYFM